MAWKNPATNRPDFDTGPGYVLGTSPDELTALGMWLVGAEFYNNHATDERIVYITDSAGAQVHQITLPPGASDPYETPFRPLTGCKVYCSHPTDVTGHLWGYLDD